MKSLIELMQIEFDLYVKLNDLLQEEQKILISQDIPRIETSAKQKLKLLEEIKKASEDRLNYLKNDLNLHVDSSFSFANWLMQNSDEALKLWLSLESMVISAKSTNDINAELIQRYLSETNQALEILKGASIDLTQSYDKSGSSSYSNAVRHKYKA